MANPLRIALYHRVSTLDQDASLARDELRAAAARLGGEIVLSIEETGSGARNDRPGLAQLMAQARRRQIDVVIVWKLDRFGRSALDVLANIRELESAGIRFLATTQGLDVRPGGDAMSRLILGVLASVAEFEREIIKERTRLGLAKAKRSGKRLGRPMVLSAKQAAQVKALRGAGRSWAQVASEVGCKPGAARLAGAR